MPADNHLAEASNQGAADDQIQTVGAGMDIGPSWLHLVLVAILVTALISGPVVLLKQLDPSGPWRLMPLFALIVAIESVLTRRWLDWPTRRRQRPAYSLAELTVLLALAPLFLWLATGRFPFPTSLVSLLEDPLAILSYNLVLYMLLAFIVWERAHSWSGLFIYLAITPDEIRYYATSSSERAADRTIVLPSKNRSRALSAFVQGWIIGGILLIVATALASLDLRAVTESGARLSDVRTLSQLGLQQDILLALLVYLLAGLWLISLGRIAVLKGRWLADHSQHDSILIARWRRWALFLLIALALLASLLPIGNTLPLFQIVEYATRVMVSLVVTIISLAVLLIHFILSLLPNSTTPAQSPVDLDQLLRPEQVAESQSFSLPPALIGSVFWIAIIALIIFAAIHFMRGRGPDSPPGRLWSLWRGFWAWLSGAGRSAAARVTNLSIPFSLPLRRPSAGPLNPSRFRFLRVNALPPREQIRFLYLSLVRQAGRKGLERSPAATPQEFARKLKSRWTDDDMDFDTLTDAFLAARYSAQEIDKPRLRVAKNAWMRIRRVLNNRTNHSPR